jgi:hypothetical protein
MMGKLHAPAVADSPRLQRVLALLEGRGKIGATTREITHLAEAYPASTAVSELRNAPNFIPVHCEFERTTDRKARVHRYTLERFLADA